MDDNRVHHQIIPSRFGDVVVIWRENEPTPKILGLTLPRAGIRDVEDPQSTCTDNAIALLCEQIRRYLEGEVVQLPVEYLERTRCSDFQWRVLMAEKDIPRGYVRSYGQLAAAIGEPKAARAVGTALARNPFPLIIPCHRTVRRDGSLGGFGGGLPLKRALLEMEGVTFDQQGIIRPEHFWVGGPA